MAPWTAAEAASDAVSKKMLLTHLQENGSVEFLEQHKLNGQANAVLKRVTKDALVSAYTELAGMGKSADASGSTTAGFKFSPPDSATDGSSPAPAPTFTFNAPSTVAAGSTASFSFNFDAPPAGGDKPAGGGNMDTGAEEGAENAMQQLIAKRMAQLNMSAKQRRDESVSALPAATRGKVEELEKLQEKTDELQKEFDEKLAALRQEYDKKKAPLFKQRSEIVNSSPGVPNFWLQCLMNHMMLGEEIQKADEPVLAYLKDIKCSSSLGPGKPGFQLAFIFGPNPFFENDILTKVSSLHLATSLEA